MERVFLDYSKIEVYQYPNLNYLCLKINKLVKILFGLLKVIRTDEVEETTFIILNLSTKETNPTYQPVPSFNRQLPIMSPF